MSNFTEPFSTPPRLQAATLAGRFIQPQSMSNAPIDFHLAGAPRGEWLISVITNGNILYLVTFKWLLTGTYGLPHTFNALTQYISYLNSLVYHFFSLFYQHLCNFLWVHLCFSPSHHVDLGYLLFSRSFCLCLCLPRCFLS